MCSSNSFIDVFFLEITSEVTQFMSVHNRTWDLNSSFPIEIIKAEVVGHFLEFLETQLNLVQEDTVVCRSGTALSLSLSDHEKVGIFRLNYILIHDQTAVGILTLLVLEHGKSLFDSLGTDHERDFRTFSGVLLL